MAKITSLSDWKKEKQLTEPLSNRRIPLIVSHIDGTIKGELDETVGTKIAKVKEALDRLEALMKD